MLWEGKRLWTKRKREIARAGPKSALESAEKKIRPRDLNASGLEKVNFKATLPFGRRPSLSPVLKSKEKGPRLEMKKLLDSMYRIRMASVRKGKKRALVLHGLAQGSEFRMD